MRDQLPARRLFATLFGAFSLAVFAMGIGLAVYAGIQWLQTARWQPLTLSGLLTSWPGTREWIDHPRTWLGLHRIFMWVRGIPLFVIVTLVGGGLIVASPPLTRSRTWDNAW